MNHQYDDVSSIETKVHTQTSEDKHLYHNTEANTNIWSWMFVNHTKNILKATDSWN